MEMNSLSQINRFSKKSLLIDVRAKNNSDDVVIFPTYDENFDFFNLIYKEELESFIIEYEKSDLKTLKKMSFNLVSLEIIDKIKNLCADLNCSIYKNYDFRLMFNNECDLYLFLTFENGFLMPYSFNQLISEEFNLKIIEPIWSGKKQGLSSIISLNDLIVYKK